MFESRFAGIESGPGASARAVEAEKRADLAKVPLVTSIIFIMTVLAYLHAGNWIGIKLFTDGICVSPFFLIRRMQVYRAFTYMFYSGSHLQFLLCGFVLIHVGRSLELSQGTILFANMFVVLGVYNTIACSMAGWVLSVTVMPKELYRCQIGMSGLLMSLIGIDAWINHAKYTPRICGSHMRLSAWSYPVGLCAVLQISTPSVLLMWNIIGVLGGVAYARGLFRWCTLSAASVNKLESHASIQWVQNWFKAMYIAEDPERSKQAVPNFNPLLGGLATPHAVLWSHEPPPDSVHAEFVNDQRPASASEVLRTHFVRGTANTREFVTPIPKWKMPTWHKEEVKVDKNIAHFSIRQSDWDQNRPSQTPQTTEQARQAANLAYQAPPGLKAQLQHHATRGIVDAPLLNKCQAPPQLHALGNSAGIYDESA